MAQHNFSSEEHSASPTTKQTGNDEGVVNIGGVLERWRTIGCTKGLSADTDIASFLLQCYEDVSSRRRYGDACCVHCHSPLTLCCLRCSPLSPLAHPLPSTTVPLTTTTTTHPSLPQAYNEEEEAEDVTVGDRLLEAEETATGAKDTEIRREIKISACLSSFSSPQICVGEKVTERTGQDDERILEDGAEERVQDSTTGIPEQDIFERSGPVAGLGVEESAPEVLKCLVCCESFTEPDLLTVHMHTHTGDSAHGCDLSAPSFLQTEVLEQQKLSNAHQHQCIQVKHIAESSLASVQEPLSKKKVSSTVTEKYDRNSLELSTQVANDHTDALQKQSLHVQVTDDYTGTLQKQSLHVQVRDDYTGTLQKHPAVSRGVGGQRGSHDGSPGFYDSDTDVESEPCSTNQLTKGEQRTIKDSISEPSKHAWNKNPSEQTVTQPELDRQQNWESIQHKCQKCGHSFQSLDHFSSHACVHGTTSCDACKKTFASASLLKRHQCGNGKGKQTVLKQSDALLSSAEEQGQSHTTTQQSKGKKTSAEQEEKTSAEQTQKTSAEQTLRHNTAQQSKGKKTSAKQTQKTSAEQTLSHNTAQQSKKTSAEQTLSHNTAQQSKKTSAEQILSHNTAQQSKKTSAEQTLSHNTAQQSKKTSAEQTLSHNTAQQSKKTSAEQTLSHNTAQQSKKTSAVKTGTGVTWDKLECDMCSIRCSTVGDLQRHKSAEHEGRGFQCGQCGKVLCTMQTLVTHQRTHTGAKPYQCPQCPSTFRSSSNLQAHLRTHSGHTPYLCPQCGRGFKEITHLKRHLVSHSGEKPYRCQLCDKAYVHATSLKEHMLSHSPTPKTWVCHHCGKAFLNSKRLNIHLKTHDKPETGPENTAPRRYVCQICNAAYQQASSLSRHKKLHKDGASMLACLECGQTFRDKYELKKHSTVHGRNTVHLKKHRIVHREGTPFQCNLCSKKFRDGSSHQQHLLSHCTMKTARRTEGRKAFANSETFQRHRQTQSHVKPHACPQCSQTFFTPWTLRLHLQHHSVSNSHSQEKSHVCAQCGATYMRAHSLVRHLRLHEGNQGQNNAPYRCTLCDRVFGDSSHLKRHLLSHSGEKPFVCASCGRAYADSHTLKDHMQVHSGVCSFVCEVCGKAFFSAKRLKEHARSHSEQRPFQCTECSASYKHLSGLVSHRRVHTGLRPFSCGECGKTFKDYTCYKRHQLTHSQHRPHACQQCGKAYKDVKNLRHHMVQLHGSAS